VFIHSTVIFSCSSSPINISPLLGWKMNPVNFDSVFNQSSHSFTFGSPDILPMFKHGASDPSRVDAWSYDEAAEDFTKDAAQLDIWVLERLKRLLSEAKRAGPGSSLDRQLRSDQVFFFLHLLGLDTTGHSYRPHSPEYFRNIQVVDQIVRGTQEMLEKFYGDDRTAFIFTADHGMSNIGNHGDGDPDNTRTPLVAWGSGIQKGTVGIPFVDDGSLKLDPYYQNWNLNMTQRKDVEQADIAALMVCTLKRVVMLQVY
jgi:phosphatidylinositol glycan class N